MNNPFLLTGSPKYHEMLLISFYDEPISTNGEYLVWGDDDGTFIAINSNSEVISIDDSHNIVCYINKSANHFSDCLKLYDKYCSQVNNSISESEEISFVNEFSKSIDNCDNSALDSENNWWSCIVSQAFEGNL